jgi:hypothetical protein
VHEVNWLELSIGGAIGFLAAVLAVVVVEGLKSPNFTFEADVTPPASPQGVLLRFVHVKVQNVRRPFLLRFLDETAYLFTADIEVHGLGAAGLLIPTFRARWPSSEDEPGTMKDVIRRYRETMPPGDHGFVDVALKFNGDTAFWGFNTSSYAHGGKDPEKRVDAERAFVVVVVNAQGKSHRSPPFLLENPGAAVDDFDLRPTVR